MNFHFYCFCNRHVHLQLGNNWYTLSNMKWLTKLFKHRKATFNGLNLSNDLTIRKLLGI